MSNPNNHPIESDIWLSWQAAFELGAHEVGGKAWNLGRLVRYGFNVPTGGVIPISIYKQFIHENELSTLTRMVSQNISLENVNHSSSIELSDKIQAAIMQASFSEQLSAEITSAIDANLTDKPLAVRSSATAEDSQKASFAGIHESYLNVTGKDAIIDAIKKCFASIWSTRAIAYRRKMEINDEDLYPAVIIMELVEADAAGVAFSCDPASGREDVCLVNANFGLGESVVNGTVESDTYLINRYNFKTEKIEIGKKSMSTCLKSNGTTERIQDAAAKIVLSDSQQHDLGLQVNRIYESLGDANHQDIEWAIKNDVIYILQARPVTVLPRYTPDVLSDQPDIWSNSNFRDALPMVLPVLQRDSSVALINHTIITSFTDIGMPAKPGLSICKIINGRLYFNTGLYQRIVYHYIGMLPDDFNLYSGGHQPNIEVPAGSPFAGFKGIKRLLRVLSYAKIIARERKHQQQLYATVDNYGNTIKQLDLGSQSDQELLELIHASDAHLISFMGKYMALCAGVGPFVLAIKSLKSQFKEDATGIVSALATGQGDLPSAHQVYGLLRLAEIAREDSEAYRFLKEKNFSRNDFEKLNDKSEFKQEFKKYLDEFGFRATAEADISSPRWSEDPSYLLGNIASAMPTANLAAHKEAQIALHDQALNRLNSETGLFKRLWVKKLIKDAIAGSNTRETAKAYSLKLTAIARLLYLEAGKRLFNRNIISNVNDIFHCSKADIHLYLTHKWNGKGLKPLIEDRKHQSAILKSQDAPDFVINNKDVFKKATTTHNKNVYKGIAVSAGRVESSARIIKTPEQGLELEPGQIMVAPSTDPSWTPLFLNAAGIVLETGGYTSHGSIVAREYGIPAVVNIPGALKLISDKQCIIVDGIKGLVILKN